mmetsp:Transcript_5333/g.13152  ORF Transcript_5333/g.13152 Transcript_5333/m.13152 type:complete len:256 (-) Transcript_5333:823-1590(-)
MLRPLPHAHCAPTARPLLDGQALGQHREQRVHKLVVLNGAVPVGVKLGHDFVQHRVGDIDAHAVESVRHLRHRQRPAAVRVQELKRLHQLGPAHGAPVVLDLQPNQRHLQRQRRAHHLAHVLGPPAGAARHLHIQAREVGDGGKVILPAPVLHGEVATTLGVQHVVQPLDLLVLEPDLDRGALKHGERELAHACVVQLVEHRVHHAARGHKPLQRLPRAPARVAGRTHGRRRQARLGAQGGPGAQGLRHAHGRRV